MKNISEIEIELYQILNICVYEFDINNIVSYLNAEKIKKQIS